MAVDLRPVNGFVAASRPARSLRQPVGMVAVADENAPVAGLLLEMAFQAKVRVALGQHPLVYRAVRRMAAYATFANRFVFEHKRPALGGVTLETRFVMPEQRRSPSFERLREVRSAAFNCIAFVRVMTISATDFAFEDGMMMWQVECGPHFGVALETGRRRSSRIDDLVPLAPALYMETSRAMAGFAAHVLGVVALRFQARMGGGRETFRDRFVTRRAFFRADKLSPRDTWGRHNRAARFKAAAGKKNKGE
jgi:hypothetical protein